VWGGGGGFIVVVVVVFVFSLLNVEMRYVLISQSINYRCHEDIS